ncbi:MFS transporter [Rhodobacteraceae bacterium RKSG542]|uniref:MFS transporter n=1 Tax=Pseudovibrio flavus TaxID=2529854 RepID=UPI0012BB53E5|nr:MFS transporter [Pseudovibrio flavus]MTI18168.1 MFS transporter [Pseudovibrio flavus]
MNNYDKLGGGTAWLVWSIATMFSIASFAFSAAYGVTSTLIAEDLGLTLAQIGILGAIYTWAVAVMQLLSGPIMDHMGLRSLPYAAVFSALGGFLYANSVSFEMLVLANLCMSIGGCFAFVGAGLVGGRWFGFHKFGMMLGIVAGLGSLFNYVNQNILRSVVLDYGWSASLNFIATVIAVIVVLMLIFVREPRQPDSPTFKWPGFKVLCIEVVKSLTSVAGKMRLWWNTLHAGTTFGAHLSISLVWGPILLMQMDMTLLQAVSISSFAFLGYLIGCPLWVWFCDRVKSFMLPASILCFMQGGVLALIILYPDLANRPMFFLLGLLAANTVLNYPIAGAMIPQSLLGAACAQVNAMQFLWTGILMAVPGLALSGVGIWAMIAGTSGIDADAPTLANFQSAFMLIPYSLVLGGFGGLFTLESYPSEKNAHLREEQVPVPSAQLAPAE